MKKIAFFGAKNWQDTQWKEIFSTILIQEHLLDLVHGVLVIYLQENLVAFSIDSGKSRHSENRKSNFLMLSEEPIDDINYNVGKREKKSVLILLIQKQNFLRIYMAMAIKAICISIKQRFVISRLLEINFIIIFVGEVYVVVLQMKWLRNN